MWLEKLKLKSFRNYEEQEIEFSKNINIIYGENAQGKTNIIEAIFISSLGKSFRAGKDKEVIKFNKEIAEIETIYNKSDRDGKIKINISDKKNIFINNIKIKKLSEILGNINIVLFSPDDINILKGSPENRRKFLDIMISQLRPNYMHIYSLYKKTLDERNNYLKKIKIENNNLELLEIWDEQLIKYGKIIANYRKEFIEKIKSKLKIIHNNITDNSENIEIEYVTDCLDETEYKKILNSRKKLDIIKGYTTRGIHRDDFKIYINEKQVNIYGSQGQHRTAMLSLKLSEQEVIKDEIGEDPILLLDDFMSELDEKRINNFLKYINNTQVIITCTEKFELNNKEYKLFNVKDGLCTEKNKK